MPDKVDSLANCRVLVVEDDEGIHQLLIGHFLDLIGIKDIEFAIDGVVGLEAARRWHPDLIVLDLEMPRMNGLEMLRQLKADFTLADIPVIIETAEESSERREQMFELGATDFVSKPLICKEFQGRVKVHLENRLHVRRLEADLERIQQELRDAATLQRALLPSSARLAEKEKRYGLIIRQVFEPCSQLGGDFWGMIPIDDRRVGVFICDFAGHGVGAAMNTFQLHTLLERLPAPDPADPAAFVHLVNQSLCANLNGRQYATFLFAVLDLSTDRLRYAAGASPNPIVGRRGTTEIKILQGAGVPLGLWAEAAYENHEIDFPEGSFLFLFSDALTEAPMLDGSLLGTDGVRALVVESALAAPPDQALTSILAGMYQPVVGSGLADDLTMVWVERRRDRRATDQQKAENRS